MARVQVVERADDLVEGRLERLEQLARVEALDLLEHVVDGLRELVEQVDRRRLERRVDRVVDGLERDLPEQALQPRLQLREQRVRDRRRVDALERVGDTADQV